MISTANDADGTDLEKMNAATGRPWKGLLASFFLWGAGQFFSGAKKRGLIWFAIGSVSLPCLLLVYTLPFIPGKVGVLLLGIELLVWLAMLYDSYRRIRPLHWWGWITLIIVSLGLSVISSVATHRLFRVFRVPTAAMIPTIIPGDQMLVWRGAYWLQPPKRGDIIVFKTSGIADIEKDPSGKEIMYDKRVIGLPGDRIEILDPEIRINGVETKFGDSAHPIEYTARRRGLGGAESYVVPEGQYFVLGDNSPNSFDSRYFGAIPREAIYGKVVKIYWPWNRMSTPR